MNSLKHLLVKNRSWATEQESRDPNFFSQLALGQSPKILWIGCSDSRVPAELIVRAQPGELFVHRNIANMVEEKDDNLMSVVQYAVENLGVNAIVICGHHGCGGIQAALNTTVIPGTDPLTRRLASLRSCLDSHLHADDDDPELLEKAVHTNVHVQLDKLSKTALIQRAWAQNNTLTLFGCVYDLHTGLLDVLERRTPPEITT